MKSKTINHQNLQVIVDNLGDDYVTATEGNVAYHCPFCDEDGDTHTDKKLYINTNNMKYICFRCGRHGTFKFLDRLQSNSEVYDILEGMFDISGESLSEEEDDPELFYIPKHKPVEGTVAYDYITSRGITQEDIDFYDIRVSDLSQPQLYGRFIIPNKVQGKVFTDMFVARTYLNDPTRYKNSMGAKRNKIVFNLHRIPDNPPCIIINEGAINSIVAGRLSVATYGKFVSEEQIKMILSKNPKSIYCSLDTDAYKYTMKLCKRLKQLKPHLPVYIVELPEGKDACDLGRDAYMKCVLESKEYKDYSTYVVEKFLDSLESPRKD